MSIFRYLLHCNSLLGGNHCSTWVASQPGRGRWHAVAVGLRGGACMDADVSMADHAARMEQQQNFAGTDCGELDSSLARRGEAN